MKDIHEVLRQKQAKYAQLGKQIEMLQQAAEKLREVAPLLAENDDDDNGVLSEVDEALWGMQCRLKRALVPLVQLLPRQPGRQLRAGPKHPRSWDPIAL